MNMSKVMLSMEELEQVNGGNWLTDAVESAANWVDDHKKACLQGACIIGGIALVATGVGAGAGLGLIAIEGMAGTAFAVTTSGAIVGAATGAIIANNMDD